MSSIYNVSNLRNGILSFLTCLVGAISVDGCAAVIPLSEEESIATFSQLISYMKKQQTSELEKMILTQAEKNQTLILGEHHDVNADDYFAGDLLLKLKPLGYTHLGIELEQKHQLDLDKFMNEEISEEEFLKTVYWRTDYHHGNLYLLSKAKEAGMSVHCIDSHDCINDPDEESGIVAHRDKLMYQSLERRVFSKDPTAKVVIFVGALHGLEQQSSHKCMAVEGDVGRCEVDCGNPLGFYLTRATHDKNYSVFLNTVRAKRYIRRICSPEDTDCYLKRGIDEGVDVDLIANPPLEYLEGYDSQKVDTK
ncbi:ChaN family lipoprotein [Candidatus Woesearchaeota archaeon]|nr:ChaN family lipoprotein [Candidatus Woesearchaeota archaeon]